ncbi:MAG: IPT/TIG domain-containing protein [Acidobacteriaceae bacterium]|jgi:hypothetical protein
MWRLEAKILAALLTALFATANAEAPRWVTGPPYFTAAGGTPVVWYTTAPLYFTDPGDLSANVNHAAADAMVAAAAGVWNVPTSAMVLAQGGALAEHVSGANSTLSSSGPVFPADVESANYAAVQIAVIYDSDGSVTDLLLGSGASSPAECRQNAVTESVDSIVPAGFIQHAILVLNGLCTGPAPEQQLQMQYQLERAFGRVLGVGWSQTNDNVFTGSPQPTAAQALHWPIMHPIDIVCGLYTYQCLPQPFTLRDDDVGAISVLYPMAASYLQASKAYGTVSFPTGQGMQGVNVVLARQQGGVATPQGFEDVSSVSGFLFEQNAGNPVTGPAAGMAASMGSPDGRWEGYYSFGWIPDIDPSGSSNGPMLGVVSTEAVNSLYIETHSVGPYVTEGVAPSGSSPSQSTVLGAYQNSGSALEIDFAPQNTASNCATVGGDGTETAPEPVAPGGWWTGVLCAHGHTAWSSFSMQAGRTATLEVTALDESGLATTAKAMPLMGAWAATDATGTLPTVAATVSAFNTISLGMTAVGLATAQAEGLRFVIADARGDGRPDFAYQARVLYAGSIQPAAISTSGGQIAISGMGFRAGNAVMVNGVAATVESWTATTILAVAPPESAFAANPAGPVEVEVVDLSTHGTTVMSAALTYSAAAAPDLMTLVSAPSGTVLVGAATVFAVRVVLADGVTPVVGLPVTFSAGAGLVGSGSAQFGACTASPCVVLTDATGLAATMVTATAFGVVTVQAAAVGAVETATFSAVTRNITAVQPVEYVAAGATVEWTAQVSVVENGTAAAGTAVAWASSAGMTVSPAMSVAGANGVAQATAVAGPLAAGAQAAGQACAWTNVCATFAAVGVDASAWRLAVVSGAGQSVASLGTFAPVVLMVTDASGDPVAGAAVSIYQTANAAEMACPARGPCPIAPMLGAANTAAVSDANGLVSIVPMQIAGVAEVTNLAVAAGTQGFVSLALTQQP